MLARKNNRKRVCTELVSDDCTKNVFDSLKNKNFEFEIDASREAELH